jgi:outer membrane protein TolC
MSDLWHQNARASYRPRVDVGVSGDQSMRSYVEQGIDYDPYADRNFRGGLNSSVWMPIDVSGNIRRQVAKADTQRQIAGHEIAQARLDVALDAQNAYLNALRAQENVAADERLVEQIKQLLERSRTQAPGVVPFLEVELGNAQQSLQNSRTGADQAQDGLKQTLRMPLETSLRLTSKLDSGRRAIIRDDLFERAVELRPDVQQAKLRVRQAEIAERQVTDGRKPSVSVSGYFNQEMVGPNLAASSSRRISNRGIGVNVRVPIAQYDGGQLSRQRQVATIQKEQALADRQELEERVLYDLRQAQLALERAGSRIANLPDPKQAFDALRRAEQQMLGAPAGQAQSLLAQVSNARNAWRSAQVASVDAMIDYNRALFRLKRTVGDTDGVNVAGNVAAYPVITSGSM